MAKSKDLYCSVCDTKIDENDKYCPYCLSIFSKTTDEEEKEIKCSDDYKILRTCKSLISFGTIFKCCSIIAAIILFICSLINVSQDTIVCIYGIIISIGVLSIGFSVSLFLNWAAYMLKLNYKNSLNKNN